MATVYARIGIAEIAAILLLAALLLYLIYAINGPSWDLIVHYLNAKTLFSSIGSIASNRNEIITYITTQSDSSYYENFRAPLSAFVMMLMIPFEQDPITPYLALLFAALAAAVWYASKSIKIDMLVLFAIVFNPYTMYYTFIFNSTEVLSMIFLLLGISLVAKKSVYAGALLGIATLAKYPMIMFLPLLLLLGKPKKIAYAALLAILVVLPWLAFNYAMFGNPLMSYLQSFSTAIGSGIKHTGFLPEALFNVLCYPAALFAVAIGMYLFAFGGKLAFARSALRLDETGILVLSVLGLAIIEFVFTGGRYDVFVQSRFGYILALAAEIGAAYAITLMQQKAGKRPKIHSISIGIVIGAIAIAVLSYAVWWYYSASMYSSSYYYNPYYSNSLYSNAKAELASLGYGNCRVITNAWPYMRYLGVHAYMPFYENATEMRYPILSFSSIGPQGIILNINDSREVYANPDFAIYLPNNFTCMH
ncbi:MAG: hypothetical protein ACP5K9_01275 [Candidatus Micrarchaeia archaeon]